MVMAKENGKPAGKKPAAPSALARINRNAAGIDVGSASHYETISER